MGPPWNEALSPPSRRQEGEKAKANGRLGGGSDPSWAPQARLAPSPQALGVGDAAAAVRWGRVALSLAEGLGAGGEGKRRDEDSSKGREMAGERVWSWEDRGGGQRGGREGRGWAGRGQKSPRSRN